MSDATKPPAGRGTPRSPSRLDGLVRRAGWIIAVERLWPAVVLAAAVLAVFVALSWLGLWIAVPRGVRIVGVVVLALGLGAAGILGVRRLPVARGEALRRLDRDSGLAHRPVSATEDRLANAAADPLTRALWDLSRKRLDEAVARIRLRMPSPRLVERDPYALRAAALLGLVAAAFVAGDHKDGLVAAAFDWRGASAGAVGFRVDAWVDPPGYTGKPPVVLIAGSGAALPVDQAVSVPVRSTVVVRASGEGVLAVTPAGALHPAERKPGPGVATRPGPAEPEAHEWRFTLDGSGRLALDRDGSPLAGVALTAIPDLPPTIALNGQSRATERGGLTLAYRIDDDYGVTGAEAAFTDPVFPDRPLARSLVPPPKLPLNLPPTPGGLGPGQTTGDLSDHPWAGSEVTVVLSTKDEGGNVGLSAPTRMTLPARRFNNPLARALVEQRRDLVFDPDHRDGIATALDALMIEPDRFGTSKAAYLGLYTARQRLGGARTDEDLVGLADYLWQMALRLEDGDSTAAARDLKAAEQALRDALQRGAAPDEIKKLTDALKTQMDKFLAEMAQNSQTANADDPPDPNARTITQNDLQQMMQRMEQMAQSGDTAEAQRMLDQLQNMLDNLKTARNGSKARQAMRKGMSELDKMTRDQQGVRDKTFRQSQRSRRSPDGQPQDPDGDDGAQNGDPQSGSPAPDGDQADSEDLQGQQQSLRQRLEELQQQMRQLGLKGEKGLDDADQAMKDAEGALGQGPPGGRRAVDAQGRALQGLQQGASGLAQQMAQGQGEGSGQADGQGQGGQSISQGSAGDQGNDPLGRPRDGRGTVETRGRALDESVAARAQRVLQELRRRLGDPNRATDEMDYLERLLQPY